MGNYPDFGKKYIGRNIAAIRNLRGMKQDVLAKEIGLSQSKLSEIENSDSIDEELLIKIAEILQSSPEEIKSFSPISALYNVNNSLENVEIKDTAQGIHQVFNPIEKVVELYERLLASEKEKLELLRGQQKL